MVELPLWYILRPQSQYVPVSTIALWAGNAPTIPGRFRSTDGRVLGERFQPGWPGARTSLVYLRNILEINLALGSKGTLSSLGWARNEDSDGRLLEVFRDIGG